MDSSDVTGLAETAIGLGATLIFTNMMLDMTKNMTNNLSRQSRVIQPKRPIKRNIKKRK